MAPAPPNGHLETSELIAALRAIGDLPFVWTT